MDSRDITNNVVYLQLNDDEPGLDDDEPDQEPDEEPDEEEYVTISFGALDNSPNNAPQDYYITEEMTALQLVFQSKKT